MLFTRCHRLYSAHCKKNSGSRSSNFAKMPCQTLQIAQLSSLPTNSSPGNCRVNPTWELIQQTTKSSFLCWAYSCAGSRSLSQSTTCCTKAHFPGMRKEEQTFCWGEWQELHLLVAVTAHTAWSACEHLSVHREKQTPMQKVHLGKNKIQNVYAIKIPK